ncbi:MAG: hypothetical protein D6718_03460 [Acidobacteria bacterium]|nr:MAG: hypothetical protein D6718_03460 [Acidobacteriota bacterium]
MRIDDHVLDRLEWASVLEMVAGHARTPMGRRRILELRPRADIESTLAEHRRVEEIRRLHAEQGRLPIVEVADPGEVLTALGIAGRVLGGIEIYETVRLLDVAAEVAEALRKLDPDRYPELAADWARFPDLGGVRAAIGGNVTPTGHVEDHASPELARLRREIRHLSDRLTSILESLLDAEWTRPVLRDRYITVRNDRFVLPVRVDTPRRFPGIVHGRSGSEKTLFVEPMETVEINNQLVRLKDEEAEEVERILAGYTELLRGCRAEIAETSRVLADIDRLEAVAAWADAADACRPQLGEGGLTLVRARHPVLERSLARSGRRLIPLDIDIDRETRVLVISGPNAGGKTVALKTIGLLALMAHAGLPVPAERARFPLFGAVMADIGDQQSIDDGLSTFASHVRNLAAMVREAEPPALALADEIGTGTDPSEGAALGIAVLDRLRRRGVHVVATTHHQAVKTWAYRTPGALNAAAEFDERTLRPTYRIVPGVAGASIGLTIAEQLGLPREVVEEARRRLDPAGAEAARELEAIRRTAAEIERERENYVARRRELEARLEKEREKLARTRERLREDWERQVKQRLEELRRESQRILDELRRSRDRRALERSRAEALRRLERRYGPREEPVPERPRGWSPRAGERVLVASLRREGVVRSVSHGRAQVELGRSVFTVAAEDLRPGSGGAAPAAVRKAPPDRPGVHAELSRREVPRELILIGKRVDEALPELDRYIDDACLAGLEEVRVVHGIGTGRLRAAVRARLEDNEEVASWREAEPHEGGAGATIVRLAREES